MLTMPPLETPRLLIRPFVRDDLAAIHQILDVELGEVDMGSEGAQTLSERQRWLEWTVMNYEALARLYQPPYGDRAVVLRQTGQLIGAVGFVPCLGPFAHLPSFHAPDEASARLFTTEFGLYYALSPSHQRQGYATEGARAMVDYAFSQLNLKRIVATTTYDNAASLGVMRKLGMRIEKNPHPDPPWFQAVGVLGNRARETS